MKLGLEQLGKDVAAVSADGVPPAYRFLPESNTILCDPPAACDLAIGLDADGSDRLGSAEAAVLAAPVVIDIDHHTGPAPFGHIQLVDRTAAATGELVYGLLGELGVRLTPEIATNLLAALLTDTGSFRFTNVTADSFRIAAALVEAGAHPAPIYEAVYSSRTFDATRLLGRLLDALERTPDGGVVWAALRRTDFEGLGVGTEHTEGFIDQIRMVQGSEVALFFREEPDGSIRVSLRSRGRVNVARVAERFDGGGHLPAAGCTLLCPLPEAVRRVVAAVEAERCAHPPVAMGS